MLHKFKTSNKIDKYFLDSFDHLVGPTKFQQLFTFCQPKRQDTFFTTLSFRRSDLFVCQIIVGQYLLIIW